MNVVKRFLTTAPVALYGADTVTCETFLIDTMALKKLIITLEMILITDHSVL